MCLFYLANERTAGGDNDSTIKYIQKIRQSEAFCIHRFTGINADQLHVPEQKR